MTKAFILTALLLLAGCSALPPAPQSSASPCDAGEATYACQVQRYHDVSQ